MFAVTYAEYVAVVNRVPLVVADGKGHAKRRTGNGGAGQGPRFVKEEGSGRGMLPEKRKSPLMATGWRYKAECDGEHGKRRQYRPPPRVS